MSPPASLLPGALRAPALLLLACTLLHSSRLDLISKSSWSLVTAQSARLRWSQDADPEETPATRAPSQDSSGSKKMKSLDDFLGTLPVLNVSQRHSARFECELSAGQPPDKLVWVKLRRSKNSSSQDDVQPLSLNQRLITPDRRFAVRRQSALRWTLSLDNVGPDDSHAFFLCQSETGNRYAGGARLNVLAPPRFVDQETSPSELEAREFDQLLLRCQVESETRAQLTWKREDGRPLEQEGLEQRFLHHEARRYPVDRKLFQTLSVDSSELLLRPFRRRQAGAYLCIASNGVQPGVSRRFGLGLTACFASERDKESGIPEPCEPPTEAPPTFTAAPTRRPANGQQRRPASSRQRPQPAPDKRRPSPARNDGNQVSIKQQQQTASSSSDLIAPSSALLLVELVGAIITAASLRAIAL